MGVRPELATLLLSIAEAGRSAQALGLLADGKGCDALRLAREQVKRNPTLVDSYFPLVIVALADGGLWEARRAAEQMHALDQTRPRTLLALGVTDLARGHYADAERSIRAALAVEPPTSTTLQALALALAGRGARREAIEMLAGAAATDWRGGASLNLWRTWRWYEVAGLGIVAAIVIHLAIEAIRTPYEGAVSRLLAVGMVLVAASLLLITRATRRRFEGMSPAARAIAAHEHGARRLERFTRLAPHLAVILAVLVGLFVGWKVLAEQSRPVTVLKAGECFDMPPETSIQEVPPVPCERPHGLELMAVVPIPHEQDDPFPGRDALTALGDRTCAQVYARYVGEPYVPTARRHVYAFWPEESYWQIGIRDFYCTVGDPTGRPTAGSLRDAARNEH